MAEPTGPNQPNFTMAEGFTLPPFEEGVMPVVNRVFNNLEHYTSAPLMDSETRMRLFNDPEPILITNLACYGFIMHTLEPFDETRFGVDTYIAPSPGISEVGFLETALEVNKIALPPPPFQDRRLSEAAAALARTGISVATGFHVATDPLNPDALVNSLFVPRVYIDTFGAEQQVDPPEIYAIKLTSSLFRLLTTMRLKNLEANS